jgi:hypothetical protein
MGIERPLIGGRPCEKQRTLRLLYHPAQRFFLPQGLYAGLVEIPVLIDIDGVVADLPEATNHAGLPGARHPSNQYTRFRNLRLRRAPVTVGR